VRTTVLEDRRPPVHGLPSNRQRTDRKRAPWLGLCLFSTHLPTFIHRYLVWSLARYGHLYGMHWIGTCLCLVLLACLWRPRDLNYCHSRYIFRGLSPGRNRTTHFHALMTERAAFDAFYAQVLIQPWVLSLCGIC
jgi:hypothetical protein